VTAWAIVAARYIWPALRLRQRSEALRPLLILHSFRFLGLGFLVPGVVSPDLPRAFATAAALVFQILLQHQREPAIGQSRPPALGYRR
jgi:hypothetical protein